MKKILILSTLILFFMPLSSKAENFHKYYVVKELSSEYKIIVEDSYGDKYLVEYGIGCLSMWQYEDKYIYIDLTGYLNGVGDTIYLFDKNQSCKVFDVVELNNNSSFSNYTPIYFYICPPNSFFNTTTNQCECNVNYVVQNNQCVDIMTACHNTFGMNSVGFIDSCYCKQNYVWNETYTACIPQMPITTDITDTLVNTQTTANLYQRPNTIVVIPSVINYYIGMYGKKVYTDRPDPMSIIGAMVKGETDPATYIVDTDGRLRWLKTEEVAKRLFGTNWDSYITWFSDSIIYTYKFGETIEQ